MAVISLSFQLVLEKYHQPGRVFLTASIDKFSDSIQKGPSINRFGDIPVTPGA
jgi:hypothetical protein